MAYNVTGTAGNDTLNQSTDTGPGTIVGLAGDDCILTGTGLLTVSGDSGNDIVVLQTGNTDKWSDPYGEFLAAVAAEPVYKLLGKKGLGTTKFPAAGEPILRDLGYLMHDGGHGTVPSDFDVYIKFMEMHLIK